MAFSVNERVRVIDHSINERNMLGTVKSVSGDDHQVRLDGAAASDRKLLTTDQLGGTTKACPLTY